MALLDEIQDKIKQGVFEFSRHALDQSALRRISVQEIREAIADSEVIEDYPQDKYGPSCLLLGRTLAGRALIKLITVYEPDPNLWEDLRIRKAES